MRYCVLFLWCILILGCFTMGDKRVSDSNIISQIKTGISTKQDVKNLIGEPNHVSFGGKEEIWVYMYARSVTRPTTFIPVVGLFAGGVDTKSNSLTIMFNKEGIVSKIGSGQTTGGGGGIAD